MATAPTREELLDMYRKAYLVRTFELRAAQQYGLGRVGGFCHLYIGQEAVAVGAIAALQHEDYVITSYRDHGQALARGSPAKLVMAELFGKAAGVSKGHGGSMHLFDRRNNFLGGMAIVGGQLPLATGIGWAIRYKNEQKCCLCFLGDAAVNQGSFHESLNLASLWKLPVIYVIENNRYGMGTPVERASSLRNLRQHAGCYEMVGDDVDGMNVIDCWRVVRAAATRARQGTGPTLIEARTYRFRGHSMSDPATYRTREEVEEARKFDPVPLLKAYLLDNRVAQESDLAQMEMDVKNEVDEAVKYAQETEPPGDRGIYEDVDSGLSP